VKPTSTFAARSRRLQSFAYRSSRTRSPNVIAWFLQNLHLLVAGRTPHSTIFALNRQHSETRRRRESNKDMVMRTWQKSRQSLTDCSPMRHLRSQTVFGRTMPVRSSATCRSSNDSCNNIHVRKSSGYNHGKNYELLHERESRVPQDFEFETVSPFVVKVPRRRPGIGVVVWVGACRQFVDFLMKKALENVIQRSH
jgi:hypothetical protein